MTSTSPTEYDVIVVGFGAAGAAAATQAADEGARVLVLDRGYDDGATALSGGPRVRGWRHPIPKGSRSR